MSHLVGNPEDVAAQLDSKKYLSISRHFYLLLDKNNLTNISK